MTTIPTTKKIIENNLSRLESSLNQTSPLNDKAFLRVLAGSIGMSITGLYKFGIQRAAQNLVISATGKDLEDLGRNFGVARKPAVAAVIKIGVYGTPGTVLPTGLAYVCETNGIRYFASAPVTLTSGGYGTSDGAVFNVTAATPGSAGNVSGWGVKFELGQLIAGVTGSNAWLYQSDIVLGIDEESEEDYRVRVLDEIRTVGGGSNSADYRRWSQEVPGVKRAYPFSGLPYSNPNPDRPGDRTIYIQCVSSIEPDGIAPASLLADVRTSITTDPKTGIDRQCLGSTDGTLYVEAISRKSFIFEIRGLTVDTSVEAAAKIDIESELDNYARGIAPFVDGLDSDVDKNCTITSTGASQVVNNVLRNYNGFASSVGFGFVAGSYLGSYTVNPGELAKSGGVIYA
jgi:hypothetical protein